VLVEEDVGTAVVGDQEAIAVRVALYLARRQAGALGEDIGALAVAQQLAFAFHGAEPALEHFLLGCGDVEHAGQFAEGDGAALVGEHLRNVFARRQGMVITGRLALVEGVGTADCRWLFP